MTANVLLVIMDSVRAGSTSLHGHPVETTPFLETFADRATLYRQARSPGAKSLTSHISIMTGLDVEEHNITSAADRLTPGHSVFERLADKGYATGVFSENTWLTDVDIGLKEGFETIEGPRNIPYPDAVDPKAFVASEGRGQYGAYVKACLASDRPIRSLANGVATKLAWDYPGLLPDRWRASTAADVYTDGFLAWEADQSGPWAACINYMDAHIPYEPAAEHDRWGGPEASRIQQNLEDLEWVFLGGQEPWWKRRALEGLYEGAIHQIDAELRRLISTLDERGSLDNTLVVITSDHGEGFGESDEIRDVRVAEHGISINEEVVHVPLLVRFPGQSEGIVVDDPATLSQFPAAAIAASESEYDAGTFVPAGPVRVTVVPLTDALEERASKYVDDLYPYTSTARAVYEATENGIRKDLSWRDRSRSLEIRDAQTKYAIDATDSKSRVQAAFEEMAKADVRESGSGPEAMGESTKRRLEDLGYL